MTHAVLHIDDHVLVVAKDKGVLTTPAHGEEGLVDVLDRSHLSRERLAVVHRLDRDTSGVLVFARTARAARHLAAQFASHAAEREYVATVQGVVAADSGTLTEPVLGKKAVTHFRVTERGGATSTLTLRLGTGRRNQIRHHLAGIGHPIVGDTRFGGPAWDRAGIALHARSLGFRHPAAGEPMLFHCQVQANPTPATE